MYLHQLLIYYLQLFLSVYFNFLLGLLDLLNQTLFPFFKRPYIDPVLGQCAVIILLLIFTSTKKRLYLFINRPDINLFSKFIYIITSMKKKNKKVNAAILIIGNEILSGRTQDKNVAFISNWLNSKCGISVNEVRIIPDVEKTIVNNILFYLKNLIMFLLQEVLDQLMMILQLNQFQKLLKLNMNFIKKLIKF